jgi:hypothetical protein
MTDRRRSFAWALEPEHADGSPQRWWLVEMEDGEPRRAFLAPPSHQEKTGVRHGLVMTRAHRDSFVQWSLLGVPADAPAKLAPVHTYMGQRCVLENRR